MLTCISLAGGVDDSQDPPSFPQSWGFCIGDFSVGYFFLTFWSIKRAEAVVCVGRQWPHLLGSPLIPTACSCYLFPQNDSHVLIFLASFWSKARRVSRSFLLQKRKWKSITTVLAHLLQHANQCWKEIGVVCFYALLVLEMRLRYRRPCFVR